VVVNTRIFPAVADIGFKNEEHDQAFTDKPPKRLRRLVVVLMNLRQSVREFVVTTENSVIKRQFARLLLGEELLHLAKERLPHSVGIIRQQESAGRQVLAQRLQLVGTKVDVAVPGHEQKR